MRHRAYIILAIALTLAVSCKDKTGPQPFPLPKVPSIVAQGGDYATFIVKHFWQPFFSEDRVYSRDTSLIGGVKEVSFVSAFTQYATYLMLVDPQTGLQAQQYLLSEARKMTGRDGGKVFETVLSICDAMLYDPNSPIRNEEMYIPVVEAKLVSDMVSDDVKAEAAALLPRLKLNRLGTPAADFSFTQMNGKVMRLYDVKAAYTILFFSNPGCQDCKAVIDQLSSLPGLADAIAAGNLAVVNVYPDADLEEWYNYAPIYPKNWYSGYDQNLAIGAGLYNLRAIPSLYLLDKDKKVIYKDVDTTILINYLQHLLS